jgi:hypothetical protein
MLVSLVDMKDYLGETTADYDAFLTQQITLISDAIEGYCGRKFLSTTYTQTYYYEDIQESVRDLDLYHYPLISITDITNVTDSTTYGATDYRVIPLKWTVRKTDYGRWFNDSAKVISIEYTAGYVTTPSVIASVVYDLVEERYNKKVNGMAINFGKDVQRVSVPGAISIDYDYSLSSNDRKSKYGMIIGDYANVLDPWRSEKVIIGTVRETYVQ